MHEKSRSIGCLREGSESLVAAQASSNKHVCMAAAQTDIDLVYN